MKTGKFAALLLLAACGGATLPQDDAGMMPDAEAMGDGSDAATVAPDACGWQCRGVGWWDSCSSTLGPAVESCARCGVACPVDAGPACHCQADGWWCGDARAPVETGCLKCAVWCGGKPGQ